MQQHDKLEFLNCRNTRTQQQVEDGNISVHVFELGWQLLSAEVFFRKKLSFPYSSYMVIRWRHQFHMSKVTKVELNTRIRVSFNLDCTWRLDEKVGHHREKEENTQYPLNTVITVHKWQKSLCKVWKSSNRFYQNDRRRKGLDRSGAISLKDVSRHWLTDKISRF